MEEARTEFGRAVEELRASRFPQTSGLTRLLDALGGLSAVELDLMGMYAESRKEPLRSLVASNMVPGPKPLFSDDREPS